MHLLAGHVYRLSNIPRSLWAVPHPRYGRPRNIVGIYLGQLNGTRAWHGFEVRVQGQERGVIFMPNEDLEKLGVQDLGLYETAIGIDNRSLT